MEQSVNLISTTERAVRVAGAQAAKRGWLAVVLGACAVGTVWGGTFSHPLVVTQVPVTQVTSNVDPFDPATQPYPMRRSGGFEGARLVRVLPTGDVEVLSDGFASAADPNVSFDGGCLVFAGKRAPADHWAIWELDLGSGEVRKVIDPGYDCRNPIYVSSLYTLDSPQPWYTVLFVGEDPTRGVSGTAPSSNLYLVRLDGTELQRVTFNPDGAFDPYQMPDNRVVYSGGRGLWGERDPSRFSLFAAHIDGTDLELYGAEQGRSFQQMFCATPAGKVVFVESEQLDTDGAGQLSYVRDQRPHHSYTRLTEGAVYQYLYPAPYGDGSENLIVSRRRQEAGAQSGVYRINADTGQMQQLFDDSEFHDLQAKALVRRPEPEGRSTVLNPQYTTGLLYGLNLCDVDPVLAPAWTEGLVKRLRVIEGVAVDGSAVRDQPGVDSAAGLALPSVAWQRRILGTVPVESDGSFNIEVPADIPIALQALDADGLALATCGWIWVRQRETRGCIGCHEDPELTPENVFVKAVQVPAKTLTPAPEQRRSVGFARDIYPILENHCFAADCHGGDETPLRLRPLTREADEFDAVQYAHETLLGRRPSSLSSDGSDARAELLYIQPGSARTSPLVWQLMGRSTARPWDSPVGSRPIHQMPPIDQGTPLAPSDIQLLLEWIDLGAAL